MLVPGLSLMPADQNQPRLLLSHHPLLHAQAQVKASKSVDGQDAQPPPQVAEGAEA